MPAQSTACVSLQSTKSVNEALHVSVCWWPIISRRRSSLGPLRRVAHALPARCSAAGSAMLPVQTGQFHTSPAGALSSPKHSTWNHSIMQSSMSQPTISPADGRWQMQYSGSLAASEVEGPAARMHAWAPSRAGSVTTLAGQCAVGAAWLIAPSRLAPSHTCAVQCMGPGV